MRHWTLCATVLLTLAGSVRAADDETDGKKSMVEAVLGAEADSPIQRLAEVRLDQFLVPAA